MFTLPIEIKSAFTFLATQGIKSLFAMLKVPIGGWGSVVIAAFVGSILFFGEGVIAALSPDSQAGVVAACNLVLVILSAFGIHKTYKGLGA